MLSNQWTETNTPMTKKRQGHECVKIDKDRILVIGGREGIWNYLKSTEVYHRIQRKWKKGPMMPKPIEGGQFVKASPGSKFLGYYIGGDVNGRDSSAIYGLSKDLSNFQLLGNFKKAREGHVAFRLQESISDKCGD